MVAKQLETWGLYDDDVLDRITFIIVDDCSPTPLEPVVRKARPGVLERVRLYRMLEDTPWHRNICRNAATEVAESQWVLHTDVDHTLPPLCANEIFETYVDEKQWYRLPRIRIGAADETRRKDEIPESCEFGEIRAHMDSFLITRDLFMKFPYDDAYQGNLGGGTPFIETLKKQVQPQLLPSSVHLYVYTRHVIADSSVVTLNRDTSEYKKLRRQKESCGDVVPKNPFEYEWERIL